MTSQLIRMAAKELAGVFYEEGRRSLRFRRENPDQDKYVADHWPHFVDAGISALTMSLGSPATPDHQKQVIYEAICDHWDKSQSGRAQEVLQVKFDPREREDVKHVDENPQLRSVGA